MRCTNVVKFRDEAPTYPLVMKEEKMQPLPVGNYYTKFDLKFNENNVIHCKQNFKIKWIMNFALKNLQLFSFYCFVATLLLRQTF